MGLFDLFRKGAGREAFAEALVARLKARDWPHEVVYDPGRFVLKTGDSEVNLERSFAAWKSYPARERQGRLDTILNPIFEAAQAKDLAFCAPRLLPVIRSRAQVEAWRLTDGPEMLISAGPAPHLVQVVAVDLPSSIMFPNQQSLEDWGETPAALAARAQANLEARPQTPFTELEPGLFGSAYGDYQDASRLLVAEVFEALPLRGAPVVIPATPGCVLVAGAEDEAGLTALRHVATRHFMASDRPLAYAAIIWRGGEWRPYTAAEGASEAYDLSWEVQRYFEARWTHDALSAFLGREGRAEVVAPIALNLFSEVGAGLSYWAEGEPHLLADMEKVELRPHKGRPFRVRMSDVEAVCGPLPQEPDLYPVWRRAVWPMPQQLAELRARA